METVFLVVFSGETSAQAPYIYVKFIHICVVTFNACLMCLMIEDDEYRDGAVDGRLGCAPRLCALLVLFPLATL